MTKVTVGHSECARSINSSMSRRVCAALDPPTVVPFRRCPPAVSFVNYEAFGARRRTDGDDLYTIGGYPSSDCLK
jgi:hypothetical protein